MTYEEAKKRLEAWYRGEDVNISPELLTTCYIALTELLSKANKPNKKEDVYEQFYSSRNDLSSHYR